MDDNIRRKTFKNKLIPQTNLRLGSRWGLLTFAHIKSKKKAISERYTLKSTCLSRQNDIACLTDRDRSAPMRTNPGNRMTKRTMFLACQLVNGMNDFLFSQVDFIKLPPTIRTFGKRYYICN